VIWVAKRLFRVESGDLKVIVTADDCWKAAVKAVKEAPEDFRFGLIVEVDDGCESHYFTTIPVMMAAGRIDRHTAWKYAKLFVRALGLKCSPGKLFRKWVEDANERGSL